MKRKNIAKKLGITVMAVMLSAAGTLPAVHAAEWQVMDTKAANEEKLQIVTQTYQYEFKTKDGRTYKKISFEYPRAEGGSDAALTLNRFYENLLSKWKKAAKENLEDAKSDILAREDDGICYTDEVSCTITNADKNYISVLQTGYVYTFGAHGMPYRYTYIFDAKTGKKVSAAKLLGLSKSRLNQKVRALYLQKFDQALKKGETLFYESRTDVAQTLDKIDFNQNLYYLKNGKVRFYTDPYAVGPYASGFIETAVKLP